MDLGGEVDEWNKVGSLWELMKEIRRYIMGVNEGNSWSCQVHDYTCWSKIVKLFSKAYLISRYHPKQVWSMKLNGLQLN
jgi:hypothetical protein